MKSTFLLLLLALLAPLFALAEDDLEKAKATDIEHLRKIGAALDAFKKAKGDYPDYLSDLVPDFLDAKALVSPLGTEADPRAAKGKNDPKLPCSYVYNFSQDASAGPAKRLYYTVALQEYGPITPILQCLLYQKAVNLSFGGEVFETDIRYWQYDPETLRLLDQHGWGPGAAGKTLILTLHDDEGHRIPHAPIFVRQRRGSGQWLPNRDFTSNDAGEVTIPLGGGPKPECMFQTEKGDWFYCGAQWHFGDAGATVDGEVARMTITMYPAAPMEGTVVNEHGTALAKAIVVIAEVRDGKAEEIKSMGTDERGHWSFPLIPRRGLPLELKIAHPGQKTVFLRLSPTSQPPLEAFFNHTATTVMPPPFPVKGRVLLDGKPVAGANVDLVPHLDYTRIRATTNALGEFTLLAEDLGATGIFVTADGLAPLHEWVDFAPDAPALEFRLNAGRPLKGRILIGPRLGLANAPILYEGMGSMSGIPILTSCPVIGTTDNEGRFTWEHAPSMRGAYCRVLLPDGRVHFFVWDTSKNDEFIHPIPPP